MSKYFILLVSVLTASMLAPASMAESKPKYTGEYAFEVNQTYPAVYRTIKKKAKECFHRGGKVSGLKLLVVGELFTDIKQGTITVEYYGRTGKRIYLSIEINSKTDSSTTVVTRSIRKRWNKHAAAVEKWLTEDFQECTA